jgi:predicted RNA binding protein YcfA (HicA-like mRNA interferase family)
VAIVSALGFRLNRQRGSHAHWERPAGDGRKRCVVTIDMAITTFHENLIKSMIRQSNFTREEFYGATEKTRCKL